jgi:hypothetical protein
VECSAAAVGPQGWRGVRPGRWLGARSTMSHPAHGGTNRRRFIWHQIHIATGQTYRKGTLGFVQGMSIPERICATPGHLEYRASPRATDVDLGDCGVMILDRARDEADRRCEFRCLGESALHSNEGNNSSHGRRPADWPDVSEEPYPFENAFFTLLPVRRKPETRASDETTSGSRPSFEYSSSS